MIQYTGIKIRKIDKETKEGINGVVFRLKVNDSGAGRNNNKYIYKYQDEEGKTQYGYTNATKGEQYEASKFKTKPIDIDGDGEKENGWIRINGLKHKYRLEAYEVEVAEGYRKLEDAIEIKRADVEEAAIIKIPNPPYYKLCIIKQDEEDKTPVENAVFRFQNINKENRNYGKWLLRRVNAAGDVSYGFTNAIKEKDSQGKDVYRFADSKEPSEEAKKEYEQTIFRTDSKGRIEIHKLQTNTPYRAYEVEAPAGYELNKQLNENGIRVFTERDIDKFNNNVVIVTNKRVVEKQMTKVIKNTDNMPLGNITFGIKDWMPGNENYKKNPDDPQVKNWDVCYTYKSCTDTKYKDENGNEQTKHNCGAYNSQYYNEHDPWKLAYDHYIYSKDNWISTDVSKEDGSFKLQKFRPDGTYTLYEIKSDNPYFDVPEPIAITSEFCLDLKLDVIENERTYIDIEGDVFIDEQEGKQSLVNGQYDEGEGINGVRVMLKKGNEIVAELASGKDSKGNTVKQGHYKFWGDKNNLKIETKELSNYKVEFEYNGIKYESLATISTQNDKKSKAKEAVADRERKNREFSVIEARTRINENKTTNLATNYGQEGIINYERYNDEQAKIMGSKVIYKSPREEYSDIYYADDIYHITSSTKTERGEANLDLSQTGKAGGYPYDPSKDSITDINLGLREIPLPDVAITSTLSAAEVSVNGYSNIYEYNRRQQYLNDETGYDVWIKKTDTNYNQTVTRDIYKSDILYSEEQRAKALGTAITSGTAREPANVYLTYKIKVKNNSAVKMNIKELIDYYDDNLEIVSAGATTQTIEQLDVGSSAQRLKTDGKFSFRDSQHTDNGYNNKIIETKDIITLGQTESKEFYVQFKIKLQSLIDLLDKQQGIDIYNIIEVNKVEAKTNEDKPAIAIDMDSAVGNAIPTNKEGTLEDDTDWSETIKVKITEEERKIEGIVFEDKTEEKFLEGKERKANGEYKTEDGDKIIKNIPIKLIDIDTGEIAKQYSQKDNYPNLSKESNDSGAYEFSGFIPGNYVVVYTYGGQNQEHTVQQYQSTIYQESKKSNYSNKDWYKNKDGQYSDAIDNYTNSSGSGMDGNMKQYTKYRYDEPNIGDGTKTREEIEKVWNNNTQTQHHTHTTAIDKNLKIDAYTAHMGISVEEKEWSDNQEAFDNKSGQVYKLHIKNIDFGIAERPRYKVEVQNKINRIVLKKNDGSVIKDFKPKDLLKPSNVIYVESSTLNDSNNSERKKIRGVKGAVDFSIDTEILQGAQMLVEYGFTVENRSEMEYEGHDYYQFGINKNQPITIQVAKMFNYVDNQLKFDIESKMITDDNDEKSNGGSNGPNNGWAKVNWDQGVKTYITDEVYDNLNVNGKCKYNTIVECEGLKNTNLKPGDSTNGTIVVDKTADTQLLLQTNLAATKDSMRYNNHIEIVEVTKSWGREIYKNDTNETYGQKLGNFKEDDDFNSSINIKEPDIAYAEQIAIHPPTGSTNNNILYVQIAIGMLVVVSISVGIILIRKRKK